MYVYLKHLRKDLIPSKFFPQCPSASREILYCSSASIKKDMIVIFITSFFIIIISFILFYFSFVASRIYFCTNSLQNTYLTVPMIFFVCPFSLNIVLGIEEHATPVVFCRLFI